MCVCIACAICLYLVKNMKQWHIRLTCCWLGRSDLQCHVYCLYRKPLAVVARCTKHNRWMRLEAYPLESFKVIHCYPTIFRILVVYSLLLVVLYDWLCVAVSVAVLRVVHWAILRLGWWYASKFADERCVGVRHESPLWIEIDFVSFVTSHGFYARNGF